MKKILLLVLGMIIGGGVLSVSSPVQASGLGCINYSGASFIGSVVLDASGFVIGCQQPTATGDLDLIPLSGWSTWDTYFQGPRSAFDTRLGFGCDDCWMGSDGMNGSVGIPLGFAINYYGTTYDNVFVNSNGSISFGQ